MNPRSLYLSAFLALALSMLIWIRMSFHKNDIQILISESKVFSETYVDNFLSKAKQLEKETQIKVSP